MGEVTIHVNGKPYLVGCEDGEETRLAALAADFDAKVRGLGAQAALGETRLMLMGALVLADEAVVMAERLAAAEAEAERLRGLLDAADSRAVAALEAAARKIESLAAR
ncbi:MAG TPA: cell division protein ZapA [Caulobacteraceae bacterium]|jgi:cell division protein ZapA